MILRAEESEDQRAALMWTARTWGCVLLIAVLCAAVFGGTARNAILHWDDRYHITENPWFAAIERDSFSHFWGAAYGNLYIPVAYNVLAAEVWATQQMTGERDIERLNPVLLQVVKVALHITAAIMVFVMLRRLVRHDAAALAGTLLFALHPLQTESVAWISETRGLLGAVFGLASVLAMARACADDEVREAGSLAVERSRILRTSIAVSAMATRWAWWMIAAVLLSAALLSKPAAVTIPLIGAAWLWAVHVPLRRIVMCTAPLLVLSLAAVVITRAVQSAEIIPDASEWWQRPLVAADAVWFYMTKLAWPVALAPDYGRTPARVLAHWGGWWVWIAAVVIAVAIGTGVRLARRSRSAMAAIAISLLALLPVLGLSTFHHQAISTVADRYAYLALLGPAILCAMWLSRARSPVRAGGAWVCACAALAACAMLSLRQVPHWRSDETLWKHAAAVNPDSPVAHNNLGREYQRQGRTADAEPHLVRAAELDPRSAGVLVNLGEQRDAQGRRTEAEELYRRAVEMSPRDVRALIDLGIVCAQTGRDAEAAIVLERALAIDPGQLEAQCNMAVLEMRAGKLESAAARLEGVLLRRAAHPQALYNLGLVRDAQGRWNEAAELWGRAIGAGMVTLDVYLRRADAFVRAGMLDEAEHSYLEAMSSHRKSYEPMNNLGLLYIRQGRVEDAVRAFERAAQIAPDAQEPRENLAAARRLVEDRK